MPEDGAGYWLKAQLALSLVGGLGSSLCGPLHVAAWASSQHGSWVLRRSVQLQCASTYQAFTCIMLANVPLDKGNHMAKFRDSVVGSYTKIEILGGVVN